MVTIFKIKKRLWVSASGVLFVVALSFDVWLIWMRHQNIALTNLINSYYFYMQKYPKFLYFRGILAYIYNNVLEKSMFNIYATAVTLIVFSHTAYVFFTGTFEAKFKGIKLSDIIEKMTKKQNPNEAMLATRPWALFSIVLMFASIFLRFYITCLMLYLCNIAIIIKYYSLFAKLPSKSKLCRITKRIILDEISAIEIMVDDNAHFEKECLYLCRLSSDLAQNLNYENLGFLMDTLKEAIYPPATGISRFLPFLRHRDICISGENEKEIEKFFSISYQIFRVIGTIGTTVQNKDFEKSTCLIDLLKAPISLNKPTEIAVKLGMYFALLSNDLPYIKYIKILHKYHSIIDETTLTLLIFLGMSYYECERISTEENINEFYSFSKFYYDLSKKYGKLIYSFDFKNNAYIESWFFALNRKYNIDIFEMQKIKTGIIYDFSSLCENLNLMPVSKITIAMQIEGANEYICQKNK